jgi:hypothetical protein
LGYPRERKAPESLVDYSLDVPKGGFRIINYPSSNSMIVRSPDGDHSKDTFETSDEEFLVPHTPVGIYCEGSRYNPLKFNPHSPNDRTRKLFLDFVALVPTRENILSFATKCGELGVGEHVHLPWEGKETVFLGEPLRRWGMEVRLMQRAVELWNALRDGDRSFLNTCFRLKVDGDIIARYERKYADGFAGRVVWARNRMGRKKSKDPLTDAAVFTLQDMIRERLPSNVSANFLYITYFESKSDDGPVRLPLGLRIVPDNLLGALWLQFAREVDVATEYRRCAVCAKRFDISLEGFRINRMTCSSACRQKQFRERRAAPNRRARGRPKKASQ